LEDNRLRIDYTARATQATVINLTNHSYFNLAGNPARNILGHELTLLADDYTLIDATLIPTGKIRSVKQMPFDFTKAAPIGARIDDAVDQLQLAGGYDHNWVLSIGPRALGLAATVYEPTSGRVLQVLTPQPGVQLYTGNNLRGLEQGRNGIVHGYRCGLCLETQHFPDSPNHPRFPSTVLRAGDEFQSSTVFQFEARDR
jgi:aldose 1-epimerase